MASELVEQHQQQTRQIQQMRRAEKEKTDTRLQRRLHAKMRRKEQQDTVAEQD